uniref:Putative ovule protein n=1 Tax=Solanum chacoense TaxID=4108 RepID=A0A0V0GL74_SOLCH
MSAVYPFDAKFESLKRPKNLEKLHASRMTFHSFFIGVGGSIEILLLEDSDSKNVFFPFHLTCDEQFGLFNVPLLSSW